MKILICTLLPTIALFVQFGELNASGLNYRAPDLLTPRVVPKPKPNQRSGLDTRTQRRPDKRILHGDTYISLWLDPQNRTRVVKADYLTNVAPDEGFVARNDFYMKLTDIGDFKVVGYFWPSEVLLGVRAPNPTGRGSALEPTESEWFIVHFGRAYKVKINPATEHVEDISLVPANAHNIPANLPNRQSMYFFMAGVRFIMYFNLTKGVLGAELDPEYHHPELPAH